MLKVQLSMLCDFFKVFRYLMPFVMMIRVFSISKILFWLEDKLETRVYLLWSFVNLFMKKKLWKIPKKRKRNQSEVP